MLNIEVNDVNKTVKDAEEVALLEAIPISSHKGVSTTPPPNPTSPPRNPARRLFFTVLSMSNESLPSLLKSYPSFSLKSSSYRNCFL